MTGVLYGAGELIYIQIVQSYLTRNFIRKYI